MANEISISAGLQVKNGNLDFASRPVSFRDDMDDVGGPTPGTLVVTTTGTDISLAQLTNPGWMLIQNLDDTNYVEFGLHDGSLFHPIAELPPGLTCGPFKVSRNYGEEHTIPGTGTTGVVNTLYLRANTASCKVKVEAFES